MTLPPWWVALGLLAAALAFVLYRRSRGDSGAKELDLQEALASTRTDLRGRTPSQRDSAIVVEERRPSEPTPRAAAPQRAPQAPRRQVSADDTISGEEPVSIEAGDPLAEADFHMAYGLYDQAADLVQLAIKRAPQRRDLKLKLLEIFFVWGNRDRFLELAREMNDTRDDAPAGEWDKILIMGRQIASEDAMFTSTRSVVSPLDMELHGSSGPLDMDLGADRGATTFVDLPSDGQQDGGGLDFEFDEPGSSSADSITPTVELTGISRRSGAADDPTQEVAIEDLGLEVGDLKSLDDTRGGEDMLALRPSMTVEDTVERPRMPHGAMSEDTIESPRMPHAAVSEDEHEDMITTTGILKEQTGIHTVQTAVLKEQAAVLKDQTGIMRALDITNEVPTIQYGESTGLMPTIKAETLPSGTTTGSVDFMLGDEPFTMSEVGTKLDLARAYVDMGDPEGARSILDEVLKEGTAEQKQEAERLMASLP